VRWSSHGLATRIQQSAGGVRGELIVPMRSQLRSKAAPLLEPSGNNAKSGRIGPTKSCRSGRQVRVSRAQASDALHDLDGGPECFGRAELDGFGVGY
jgi:hypothetical protein